MRNKFKKWMIKKIVLFLDKRNVSVLLNYRMVKIGGGSCLTPMFQDQYTKNVSLFNVGFYNINGADNLYAHGFKEGENYSAEEYRGYLFNSFENLTRNR